MWFMACHEAGHAVVAAEVGIPFRPEGMIVEIRGDRAHGRVHTKVLDRIALRRLEHLDESVLRYGRRELCMKLAGLLAQEEIHAQPGPQFSGNKQADLDRARELAMLLSRGDEDGAREMLNAARERAADIIRRRRKEVRKLARLALKNGRVAPDEIARVLGLELDVRDD